MSCLESFAINIQSCFQFQVHIEGWYVSQCWSDMWCRMSGIRHSWHTVSAVVYTFWFVTVLPLIYCSIRHYIILSDEIVPFWNGEELFLSIPVYWRAAPFWVRGAGHNNIEALERWESQLYIIDVCYNNVFDSQLSICLQWGFLSPFSWIFVFVGAELCPTSTHALEWWSNSDEQNRRVTFQLVHLNMMYITTSVMYKLN